MSTDDRDSDGSDYANRRRSYTHSDRVISFDPRRIRTRSRSREFPNDRSRRVRDRIRAVRESSLAGSRERLQSRSPPPTRRHSYYDELVDDIHYNVQTPIRDHHEERYIPATTIPRYDDAPVDDYGNPLTLDIDIRGEKIPNWTNKRVEIAQVSPESLSLEAAKAFTDETDTEKIILSQGSSNDPSIAKNRSHLQETYMSIRSLEVSPVGCGQFLSTHRATMDFVASIPGLNDDDLIVVVRLLHEISKRSEAPYVHGKYLEATVLRGIYHSTENPTTQDRDRNATFMNFPYFSFQSPPALPGQRDGQLHPIRSLLQTVHLLESTKVRDAEQAICKLGQPNRFGKSIHVPQVWSIAIGSDLLVTYSTISLSAMRGQTIEIQRPLSTKQTSPSVLRITDPYQRTLFFSLDLCKTWFELEELVCTQCDLGDRDYVKDNFDIFLKDEVPLTGAQWPAILTSAKPPFVDIFISFKHLAGSNGSEISGDDDLGSIDLDPPVRERKRPAERVDTQSSERATTRSQSEREPVYNDTALGSGALYGSPQSTMSYNRDEKDAYNKDDNVPGEMSNQTGQQTDTERHASQASVQADLRPSVEARSLVVEERRQRPIVTTRSRLPMAQEVSNVTFLLDEREVRGRTIVAEPESYYMSHEPQVHQRRTISRGSRSSQSLSDEISRMDGAESRSRRARKSNTRSRRPISSLYERGRSLLSRRPSRRQHMHSDNFNDLSLRTTRPRSDYYPKTPSRRPSPPLSYRHRYGQSSVRGNMPIYSRAAASIYDTELDENIYYIPKKKKESVSVNIGNNNRSYKPVEVEAELEQTEESFETRIPMSFQGENVTFDPVTDSRRFQKSTSSTVSHLAAPTKASVLPILMWPTGPAEHLGADQLHDASSERSCDSSMKSDANGPPRVKNTGTNVGEEQPSDASLREILERIHNFLLTDTSSNHDAMFRDMEMCRRKDAIYKPPEKSSVASDDNGHASNGRDDTQDTISKDDPTQGFLSATSTNDLTGQQVEELEYQKKLIQLSATANSLFERFMPADFPNIVAWRYYGSIKRIIETVVRAQKQYSISRLYPLHHIVWIITDIEDPEYLANHHLQPLSIPLTDCKKCSDGFPYNHDSDASDHLLQSHFPSDKQPSRATTMLWVKKIQHHVDELRCNNQMEILRNICTQLDDIYLSVQEICDGVRAAGVGHNPRYRLPKALVVAFRKLIIYLVYASNTIQAVMSESNSEHLILDNYAELRIQMSKIKAHGRGVEIAVEQGKFDLTMMLRIQDYTESIKRYEAAGPYYTMIMAMSNVQFGVDCREPVEVYKEYIARLSFQVSQYPRRRLIRSLKYVEEELLAIYKIVREQHDQYVYLSKVLFSEVTPSLVDAGRPGYNLELDLIKKLCFKSTQRLEALEQLLRRVTRLIEDTKTSVEINDDDHGKAILVFTIVTLVFLPLSFVASFLGMNTADIRNQTANQVLYWIIALPVTAGVVIIALVIGYKYEAMRDYIERYVGKVKKD